MSARLSLLAISTLLLSACDGNPLQTAVQKTACCCNHCPAGAGPTAKPAPRAPGAGPSRAVATGGAARLYRTRGGPVVTGDSGYMRYESSDQGYVSGGYGGRYGARGGVGVSVSESESESASSRYSYSESSSSYGSGSGGYGYGASGGGAYGYGPGGARISSDPPHYPGYRGAQTDANGYLTWPGKVED